MQYFDENFVEFFHGLANNNYKEWFHENKKQYEKTVKKPFELFVQDLILKISEFDNSIDLDPKNAIFRINRDIRFSNDKSPYKTHRGAAFAKGGRKGMFPGYYIQIGADSIHFGGGLYLLDTKTLKLVREHIIDNLDRFSKLINNDDFVNSFTEILGEKNKRLPKEQMKYVDNQSLILNKQFYYMADISTKDILFSEQLLDFISEKFKIASNINKFFAEAFIDLE